MKYYVNVDKNATHWYRDAEIRILHREHGPAIEHANGDRYWYIDGKRHRENGPAIECTSGHKRWFIGGQEMTEEEFNSRNSTELSVADIEKLLGYKIKIVK